MISAFVNNGHRIACVRQKMHMRMKNRLSDFPVLERTGTYIFFHKKILHTFVVINKFYKNRFGKFTEARKMLRGNYKNMPLNKWMMIADDTEIFRFEEKITERIGMRIA